MFSGGFLEGQTRDINDGFPSDAIPHTEYDDCLSDSDLEDEGEEEAQDESKPRRVGSVKTGKVAIIRDAAAVTCANPATD